MEVNLKNGTLFIYGENADIIFDVISPILYKTKFLKDTTIILRYGAPGPESVSKLIKL